MISTYEPRLCVTTEHGKIFGETDSKTLLKSPFIDLYDVARNLAWKGPSSDSQRAVPAISLDIPPHMPWLLSKNFLSSNNIYDKATVNSEQWYAVSGHDLQFRPEVSFTQVYRNGCKTKSRVYLIHLKSRWIMMTIHTICIGMRSFPIDKEMLLPTWFISSKASIELPIKPCVLCMFCVVDLLLKLSSSFSALNTFELF